MYSHVILSTGLGQFHALLLLHSALILDNVSTNPTRYIPQALSFNPNIIITSITSRYDDPLHDRRLYRQSARVISHRFRSSSGIPPPNSNRTPVLVLCPYDTQVSPHILTLVARSEESVRSFCATTLKLSVLYVHHSNTHDFQISGLYGTT